VAADDELILATRRAIQGETKLSITYRDLGERVATRIIWPFALAFYDQVQILVAWCELRGNYRNFRADRIESWEDLRTPYPRRHQDLLRE
jgi:predicted DNA-binding transcriptional regulator YafY